MTRDRRWDHLHDVERRPVKAWLLDRFAEALAAELRAWPPVWEDAVPAELRARHAVGLAAALPEPGVRLALALARLDLGRDLAGAERLLADEGPRRWRGAGEAAAGHLLVRLATERCLELKERAEGARLTRDDLARALGEVERLLYG